MPATYHPCLPGKQTTSAIKQPDDAYLRVSRPLSPEQLVLHHGVPVPCVLTGKILTSLTAADVVHIQILHNLILMGAKLHGGAVMALVHILVR